jgi:hypothetical protein
MHTKCIFIESYGAVVPFLSDLAFRIAQASLSAITQPSITCSFSRQERLGLIFSAIDRCGVDCPVCAIWVLEQDGFQISRDAEPTTRRLRY